MTQFRNSRSEIRMSFCLVRCEFHFKKVYVPPLMMAPKTIRCKFPRSELPCICFGVVEMSSIRISVNFPCPLFVKFQEIFRLIPLNNLFRSQSFADNNHPYSTVSEFARATMRNIGYTPYTCVEVVAYTAFVRGSPCARRFLVSSNH